MHRGFPSSVATLIALGQLSSLWAEPIGIAYGPAYWHGGPHGPSFHVLLPNSEDSLVLPSVDKSVSDRICIASSPHR